MLTSMKTDSSDAYFEAHAISTYTQLKAKFMQDKLAIKAKKLAMLQAQAKDQHQQIAELILHTQQLQQQVNNKDAMICQLTSKVDKLETQLAQAVGKLSEKQKEGRRKEIEDIKGKKLQDQEEKLNKMLTKENSQLLSQRHTLKDRIIQLQELLEVKELELKAEKEQSSLVATLNEGLKLEVEELLFEIRMLNRRQETNRMQDYEYAIDSRTVKETDSEQQDGEELMELLKLKIVSLEKQLEVSERRCKQLQQVILSQ